MVMNLFDFYPTSEEINDWIYGICELADNSKFSMNILDGFAFDVNIRASNFDHIKKIKGTTDYSGDFYGYWQPCYSAPAPLIVHVPGYGAEMSIHPSINAMGYNVMHISPLGYVNHNGAVEEKRDELGDWPVLGDTITSEGKEGYKYWLANCVSSIKWAMQQPSVIPNRVSFFGTSQGGGGALLLASIFRDMGTRCVCADEPFLTNLVLANGRGAYNKVSRAILKCKNEKMAWHSAGLFDTISHVRRITFPVLLTAGAADAVCPPETVKSLYDKLGDITKAFVMLKDEPHGYTSQFMPLCEAWLRLYA